MEVLTIPSVIKIGEKLDLKLGMYCETKIIVEQKSVLRFLLEKINLVD